MTDPAPLPPRWYDRPALAVARDLLGTDVASDLGGERVVVRLTEVEAYDGERDPGSHAFRGRTRRNGVMFGPPGHVYVYFSYGMHWCMNLVCLGEGTAAAVLLRAGEVVEGHDAARRRRPAAGRDRDLARGPARLTAALGVDGSLDGADAADPGSPLRVRPGRAVLDGAVRTGPRVGVAGDGAVAPWRFWVADDPTVSAYRPATPRRRAGAARSGRLVGPTPTEGRP